MAMTINTNIVSINAQRNLGLSGSALGTTMQRLSSGLRVNSAKDDAAGLAIAERMNAQAKGLAVASRNANDGISLAQTTEGALGKVGDMLQRMRELAVQSSNATNSETDRKALQAEVSQLRSEIDRVAKTTSFNGNKVLDGTFAGAVFQVGAKAGDNITVGATTKATSAGLGSATYGTSEISGNTSAITDLEELKGLSIKIDSQEFSLGDLTEASSAEERLGQVVSAINAKSSDTGVTAFLSQKAGGEYTIAVRSDNKGAVVFTGFSTENSGVSAEPVAVGTGAATYTTIATAAGSVADAATTKAFTDAIAAAVKADPALASIASKWEEALETFNAGTYTTAAAGTAASALVVSAIEDAVSKYDTVVAAKGVFAASDKELTDVNTYGAALNTYTGNTGASAFDFATNTDLAAGLVEIAKLQKEAKLTTLDIDEGVKSVGLDSMDITTQAGAWDAIKQIDSALDQVNAARGNLGALQTRFEKAVENIDIQSENITAARGRIVDADFASETAALSRAQILQQAGTAMVAQANQLPQNVLSLLR